MRTSDALDQHWDVAAKTDRTLRNWQRVRPNLKQLELCSQPYSRTKLFSALALQKPIIFDDFPVRPTRKVLRPRSRSADKLRRLFRKSTATTLTRLGPAKRVRYLRIDEVIEKWEKGRGVRLKFCRIRPITRYQI